VKTESLAFRTWQEQPEHRDGRHTLGTAAEQSAVPPSEPLAVERALNQPNAFSRRIAGRSRFALRGGCCCCCTGKAEQSPTAAIRPSSPAVGKAPAKILASARGLLSPGL